MKKLFTLMAIAATILFSVSCSKDDDTKKKGDKEKDPEEQPAVPTVTIDGDFADWAALDPTTVAVAKNNPDSPWEAVSEIRCFATKDFVFYYIKYDNATIREYLGDGTEELPIRLCINTDGEFTSGYQNYFLEGYDFIVEGSLIENGEWTAFDGTLHQRIDGDWTALLEPGHGLVMGAGNGNEYEIMLFKEIFNGAAAGSPVPMAMGATFHTGIRFYSPGWGELSNMPNSSMEDGDGNGWGHLLEIKAQ